MDVFSPSQILGGRPSKSYTHVMTPVPRHVVWKLFCGDTATSPEAIVAKTLNFKANFKFSRLNGDISAADCRIYFVFGSRTGFSGRRMEWHYFRFRQIQDGGAAAILKNSNGDISAADRPIYSVFGSRTGFSRSADRMALFLVSPNPRWRRSRHLEKFKWRYLLRGSSDLHRVWF